MRRALAVALGALSLTGCLSMQNQAALDGSADTGNSLPYVEAYLEYPGPSSKWAGPSPFLLHIVAKDAGQARIAVQPALFNDVGATRASTRGPATAEEPGLLGDQAREVLAHLATALQGTESGFKGCLAPVRVRLIRADGALLEKQGCRGQNPWSRAVSQAANQILQSAIYGNPKTITEAPAEKSRKPASH